MLCTLEKNLTDRFSLITTKEKISLFIPKYFSWDTLTQNNNHIIYTHIIHLRSQIYYR